METVNNSFEPDSYLSPLMENASCATSHGGYSYYRPINTINWDTDNITTRCAKNIEITGDNTKTHHGNDYEGQWPSNSYFHTFYTNNRSVSCSDGKNPILGLKWVHAGLGKYHTEYICPADDSMRFAQTKEYTYTAPNVSQFNADKGSDEMNKLFMNDTWLNKNQYVFYCPANWYLGKIKGGVTGLNNQYHNTYTWTCGTIYHEYVNDDGVKFDWRYYRKDENLMLEIITNIKLTADSNDPEIQSYIIDNGRYIDFIFTYNASENELNIKMKNSNFEEYSDVTTDCYVRNTENNIECNLPLTELSIVQFNFTKSVEDPVTMLDEGTIITELPLFFTKISMVQDTTLPKIYAVTYDTAANGGTCEGSTSFTKTYVEGDPIIHPNCTRLGHIAGNYIDMITNTNVPNGSIVSSRMYIQPQFEAVKYDIVFNNETSDFEYIQCDGEFTTTGSLNEVISINKIPTCDGEGVTFNGWFSPDKYKAGQDPIRGSMVYYPSVEYPDYKLTFNVPTGVACKDCMSSRIINRTKEIGSLPIPEKTGFTFEGWYYDQNFTLPVKETDKLVRDTTVYPKFVTTQWSVNMITPNNSVIVPNITRISIEDGKTIGNSLPTVTLSGYTNSSWYQIDESNKLVKKWTKSTPVYKNIVITAVFEDSNNNKYYKKYSEALKNNELIFNNNNVNTNTNNTNSTITGNNTSNNTTNNNDNNDDKTSNSTIINSNNSIITNNQYNINNNTNNNIITHCEAKDGWNRTEINKTSEMNCPNGYTGKRTRFCNANGIWEDINSTACNVVPMYCEADGNWPKTSVGVYAKLACENGTGNQSRLCKSDGTWSDPITTECNTENESSTNYIIYIIIALVIVIIVIFMWLRSSGNSGNSGSFGNSGGSK